MLHKVMALVLAGALLVFPLLALAQDGLGETFTTSDGSLSFNYPSGWFVNEDQRYLAATLSNVPADEIVYRDTPPGQVHMVVYAGLISFWWGSDMELSDDVTALEMAEQYPLIGYVDMQVTDGPRPLDFAPDAAMVGGKEDGSEVLRIFIVLDGEIGIFVEAFTAVGEMDQSRDTILAVAASAAYNVPDPNAGRVVPDNGPPAVAGTGPVVWQQQRSSSVENREFDGLGPVAIAEDGTIYVADGRPIRVLDADGNVTATIINDHIRHIADMIMAEDGTLWLADDANGQVHNLSTDGTLLSSFGSRGRGSGEFGTDSDDFYRAPIGLDVGPDGNLYVFDIQSSSSPSCDVTSRIQVFDTQGAFIREFSTDLGDGQCVDLGRLHMAFGPDGNLYILGYYDGIAVFDSQGTLIRDDFAAAAYLNLGPAFDMGEDGRLYSASGGGLFVLDGTGAVIAQFGTRQAASSSGVYPPLAPGEFHAPVGLAIAPNGDIIIADGALFSYSHIVRIRAAELGL